MIFILPKTIPLNILEKKQKKIIEILKELGAENITSKSIQITPKIKERKGLVIRFL